MGAMTQGSGDWVSAYLEWADIEVGSLPRGGPAEAPADEQQQRFAAAYLEWMDEKAGSPGEVCRVAMRNSLPADTELVALRQALLLFALQVQSNRPPLLQRLLDVEASQDATSIPCGCFYAKDATMAAGAERPRPMAWAGR
jgi:hypothetical protein